MWEENAFSSYQQVIYLFKNNRALLCKSKLKIGSRKRPILSPLLRVRPVFYPMLFFLSTPMLMKELIYLARNENLVVDPRTHTNIMLVSKTEGSV